MKTLSKYSHAIHEAFLWLGATFIAFVLGNLLGYIAVKLGGLWFHAHVIPNRACDYCTAPAVGNYKNNYYCTDPEHEKKAQYAAYPKGRPYRSRGWRLQTNNDHQKGER